MSRPFELRRIGYPKQSFQYYKPDRGIYEGLVMER